MVEVHAPCQAAEEARKEDTKETATFEHVDHTQAAVAENALHQAEAETEIHHEKMKSMDRLECAVDVAVDMLTQEERGCREDKTDFYVRWKMIQQSGRKYNPKKYCLAVHATNRKFMVQVAYTTILGDEVGTQATSTELHRYDANTWLKNHSAAYLTGLLAVRRTLMRFGLTKLSKGTKRLMGRVTKSRMKRTMDRVRSSVHLGSEHQEEVRRVPSCAQKACLGSTSGLHCQVERHREGTTGSACG